jgi:hypothetical protein
MLTSGGSGPSSAIVTSTAVWRRPADSRTRCTVPSPPVKDTIPPCTGVSTPSTWARASGGRTATLTVRRTGADRSVILSAKAAGAGTITAGEAVRGLGRRDATIRAATNAPAPAITKAISTNLLGISNSPTLKTVAPPRGEAGRRCLRMAV